MNHDDLVVCERCGWKCSTSTTTRSCSTPADGLDSHWTVNLHGTHVLCMRWLARLVLATVVSPDEFYPPNCPASLRVLLKIGPYSGNERQAVSSRMLTMRSPLGRWIVASPVEGS